MRRREAPTYHTYCNTLIHTYLKMSDVVIKYIELTIFSGAFRGSFWDLRAILSIIKLVLLTAIADIE